MLMKNQIIEQIASASFGHNFRCRVFMILSREFQIVTFRPGKIRLYHDLRSCLSYHLKCF